MRSLIVGRRTITAGGIYLSAVLGFFGQILASRWLGPASYGLLAIVISATGFAQSLLDLTVEEAVVKYGFRYSIGEQWGKFHRLFRRALEFKLVGAVLGGVVLAALAPATHALFGHGGLTVPFLIAALLPLAQAPEGLAGVALLVRDRYDLRAHFLVVGMGTRFVALAVGSRYGVTETVLFVLIAQVVTSVGISAVALRQYRGFPAAAAVALGGDRREIISFMKQSSIATTVVTLQGSIAPLLLGIVTNPVQVGLFRVALAPQQALASLSAPVRIILLTEQTRDWEKGDLDLVFRGLRRFTIGAFLLMGVMLPPLLVYMDAVVRAVYGAKYAGAADGARLVLVASALTFVISWSKSLPVSIGRPGLRVVAHGIQALVLIPLVVVFGIYWQATGASAAVAVASAAFVAVWAVLIVRISRNRLQLRPTPQPDDEPEHA
jgi:O-antigen/teichoic acid export membrane protein